MHHVQAVESLYKDLDYSIHDLICLYNNHPLVAGKYISCLNLQADPEPFSSRLQGLGNICYSHRQWEIRWLLVLERKL
jgi:hypothetical protein